MTNHHVEAVKQGSCMFVCKSWWKLVPVPLSVALSHPRFPNWEIPLKTAIRGNSGHTAQSLFAFLWGRYLHPSQGLTQQFHEKLGPPGLHTGDLVKCFLISPHELVRPTNVHNNKPHSHIISIQIILYIYMCVYHEGWIWWILFTNLGLTTSRSLNK